MSCKPQRVVEFGIGPGYTSNVLLDAMKWNGGGELFCIDNWHDTGEEPSWVQPLRDRGAQIIVATEGEFSAQCESDWCDVLISDADHKHAHEFVHDHLRMVRPGGFLFYHDTANEQFPWLGEIVDKVGHLPHWHFCQNSREDEMCWRGWLMVGKPCV